jgi:hypothetical protein
MQKGMSQTVRDNIDKCRSAAIAAVDTYNRPGPHFRTAHFIVLINIAWTALFHAIFYHRGRRPWFRKAGIGKGVRYQKVDGEPKHWDLMECLRQFFQDKNPPDRKNLEFLIELRNKIEHRHLPELDAALYGECQAALLNLESLLTQEFGQRYALAEQLAVSLQFSQVLPEEKIKAAKSMASASTRSVIDYIERFRGGLDTSILNSMRYSFSVFLVPRVANRQSASDVAVQFVKVDEASSEELQRLTNLNVLIREKHIPIANLGCYRAGEVVAELKPRLPFPINQAVHTRAWHCYSVRPSKGDAHPERTRPEYCVYDQTHEDYVYTKAWVEKLARDLSDASEYERVVGHPPIQRSGTTQGTIPR